MGAIREKTTIEMRMRGVGETHARTRVAVRDVEGVIDEPVARGGTNQGLTPTETLLSALIGCTNVIAQRIAHHHGIEIRDLSIEARATFDRRGVTLSEEIDVPFPEVALTISVTTTATPEEIAVVERDLGRFCPIAKVVRAAGTTLTETWNITHM